MINEFKVGNEVTFQAWKCNKPIKAKVRAIKQEKQVSFVDKGRVFYELTGINKPLLSLCTGQAIVESELFNPSVFRGLK